MQRLIFQSADVSDRGNGEREAIVILSCEERQFVGRSLCSPDNDEPSAVALATLEALQQYLPVPVEFELKNAAKMQPDQLVKYLFVVKVEMSYKEAHFSLTGACLGEEGDGARSITKATLDATNQLIDHIIEQHKPGQ